MSVNNGKKMPLGVKPANFDSAGSAANGKAPAAASRKKLVIKPLKKQPVLSEEFLDRVWREELLPAVRAVQTSDLQGVSYERLYSKVEDLCTHKFSQKLYDLLLAACDEHARETMGRVSECVTMDTMQFLQVLSKAWNDHCSQIMIIRSIFLYLDRTYILNNAGSAHSVWDMGLACWLKYFRRYARLEDKAMTGTLQLIELDRKQVSIDRVLLKSLLRMLSAIGLYLDLFEPSLLLQTEAFYGNESRELSAKLDVPSYLLHTEKRIREEMERSENYFEASSLKPLLHIVERAMISSCVDALIEKGFESLCEQNRVQDLHRMYTLFARGNHVDGMGGRSESLAMMDARPDFTMQQASTNTPLGGSSNHNQTAHEKVRIALITYVKRVGTETVMDATKDAEMVQKLLDLKSKLDGLLVDAFASNETFAAAIKESFETFINTRQNKPAELVAKFIDNILRTGNKSYSEEVLESTLDRVMTLFRYIHGKDIFEAFYKKDLAKRLLFQKSASLDLEKLMISKLKQECGAAFTNKLEGMFKDIDLSMDIMTSFHAHQRNQDAVKDIDLNVYVLTQSFWPQSAPIEFKMPPEIFGLHERFKQFYLEKHSGKQLSWQHASGTCQLRANFDKAPKLLDVSLYQTVVCLLFNDAAELTYKQIQEATGMEQKELKRTLLSLACGKVGTRVLTKSPKSSIVEEDAVFIFNGGLLNKMTKIKINAIQLKETEEENKETTSKVFQDRQYQIDAAIVRIMKTRKALSHNQLINELFGLLKFPHKASDLKKRIESLIEREYLERDAQNANMYKYLA